MKVEGIDIEQTIDNVKAQLEQEPDISPTLKSSVDLMLTLVTLLVNKLGLNSSKPPSSDPNRKKNRTKPSGRKPGGQKGHKGVTLKKFEEPDDIQNLKVDRSSLAKGKLIEAGYEARQVVDLDIRRFVTEYRAEILIDKHRKRHVAAFPDKVGKAVQYGDALKAHVVYISQYQLIPYERVQEFFVDQMGIPLSTGSIFNFNQAAFKKLETFEALVKTKLKNSPFLHSHETGINIQSHRHWLHCVSNDRLTFLYPHKKRGQEAMDAMEVLPGFKGILCHDHWKPYYRYGCKHALCNAHHLSEPLNRMVNIGQSD